MAKQQLCTRVTLFCTFLCRRCTTTTWKRPNFTFRRGRQHKTTTYFSFPELWYSLLEFNSRKNCQHLTNWTRWNKRDNVWRSSNSHFEWRFRIFNVGLTPSSAPNQDGKHLRHFNMDVPLPHRRNFDLHAKGHARLDWCSLSEESLKGLTMFFNFKGSWARSLGNRSWIFPSRSVRYKFGTSR